MGVQSEPILAIDSAPQKTMRKQWIGVACAIGAAAFLGACKKSEPQTPTAAKPQAENPVEKVPTPAPAPAAVAKDANLLEVKWPVGNRYVYRLDLDQQMT